MSSFSERTRLRLQDIVENADAAADYLGGMTLADLRADRKTLDAIERCLQRVTEAVIQIGPAGFASIAPDTPAAGIRNMGNILRHEHRRIDPAVIFDTVITDLPPLRAACASALTAET